MPISQHDKKCLSGNKRENAFAAGINYDEHHVKHTEAIESANVAKNMKVLTNQWQMYR